MRKGKTKSAQRLFDAVGMIDDLIITEAAKPYVKPKKSFSALNKILALACSLVICISVGLGVFLSSQVSKDKANLPDADSNYAPPNESFQTLSEYLSIIEESAVEVQTADEIDFFDGNATLIWRFDSDEPQEYKTLTLYDRKEVLAQTLSESSKELSPEESQEISCKVWISYGDGEVVSPYLTAAEGNVGYGELFEYSPECEPSNNLVRRISGS